MSRLTRPAVLAIAGLGAIITGLLAATVGAPDTPARRPVVELDVQTLPAYRPADRETVARAVDGDTIELADGTRVRLIGVDAPERGDCGYDVATAHLVSLIAERPVILTAGPGDDRDRYGRLLRYVQTHDGRDAGYELLAAGVAVARYDSRDGYGAHPREAEYVVADAGAPQLCDIARAVQ